MLYQIKSQISSLCKQELPFVCPRKANLCGTRKEQKKRNSLKAVLWKCCTHQDSQSGFQHRRQMRAVWSFWICSSVVSASLPSSNTKHPKGFMFTGAALAPLHSKPPPPSAGRNIPAGSGVLSGFFQAVPLTPGDAEDPRVPSALVLCHTSVPGRGFCAGESGPPFPPSSPKDPPRAGELQKDVLSWQGVLQRVCCKEKKRGEIPPFR